VAVQIAGHRAGLTVDAVVQRVEMLGALIINPIAQARDRRTASTIAVEGDRMFMVGSDDDQRVGVVGQLVGLVEEVKTLGGQYVWDDRTFAKLNTEGSNAPILGLFESSHMNYEHDRTGEPSLAEMTETAIKALKNNENGYLNVEAGRVDHANHDGNLHRTLTDGSWSR